MASTERPATADQDECGGSGESRRWLYVIARCDADWQADLFSEALMAAGAAGVELHAGYVATWFSPPAEPDTFLAELEHTLADAAGIPVRLDWSWQADADWAREWRRGLAARRIGSRLVVTPSWITPEPHANDIVITIDPQMAFGTGEHATTRSVLRLLEAALRPGDTVLDVGTGSGILAIAAALLGAGQIDGVEYDGDALINARENIAANRVAERIALLHAAVDLPFLDARAGHYQLILGNVLSGILRPLLPGFFRALQPGGRLILSGILQTEAPLMLEASAHAGFAVEREEREEDWWTALLYRP